MHYQYTTYYYHVLGLVFVSRITLKFYGTIPPSWQYETLKRDPFNTTHDCGMGLRLVWYVRVWPRATI